MDRLVSPERAAAGIFDPPYRRSRSLQQSGAGASGKKPVRAEQIPVGSSGVPSDLIAIIESRRSAWSAPELAELLGCTGKHIYALAKSGSRPHLRIGGMVRFDPSITAAWLRERFIAA